MLEASKNQNSPVSPLRATEVPFPLRPCSGTRQDTATEKRLSLRHRVVMVEEQLPAQRSGLIACWMSSAKAFERKTKAPVINANRTTPILLFQPTRSGGENRGRLFMAP